MPIKDPVKQRANTRKHYLENKEAYYERSQANKRRLKDIADEQKSKPCMDCDREYPLVCMDFDHRPGEVKVANVNRLINTGSTSKLLDEIAKCDVVCSNCHRIRTQSRRS